ncbi:MULTISPECIES: hypothetical protein [unclassified Variovorax]|uniref:hypothetical protein n=1 Tax=unclassified Variovorax TaxID=663243 RepID=UPI0011AF9483|nr:MULTISPECIES: hypothetical protein [unclassified Variovorax]
MLVGAFHEPVYMPTARADVIRDLAGWFAIPVLGAMGLAKLGVRNAGRLLQNTLTQTLLALLALAAFVSTAPAQLGAVPAAFMVLFLAGRLAFFVGHAQGPLVERLRPWPRLGRQRAAPRIRLGLRFQRLKTSIAGAAQTNGALKRRLLPAVDDTVLDALAWSLARPKAMQTPGRAERAVSS